MKDQVRLFNQKEIRVAYVGSDYSGGNVEEVIQGEYQVLLFGPERILLSSKWREMLLSSLCGTRLRDNG